MKDEIVIAEALGGEVRIHIARTTNLVEEARKHHNCMPTSIAALGRTLTATSIMASDLKNNYETITCIINGKGPSGTILAQANGEGKVRGFIGDPSLYFVREDGHLDVGKAVGTNGNLTVIRDSGLKEAFTGVSPLQSGEIGDDFTYYFAISEQVPSVVGVGVLVDVDYSIKAAGGLIYQLMPGAKEETIVYCEELSKRQKPVSTLISEGRDLEEIIKEYFPDADILEHRDISWYCDCSKEKFAYSLMTLADDDLNELIEEGKGAEVRCEYCNTFYNFSSEELEEIKALKKNG